MGQNSSVVLLLPHGYEGQGPDHSSARIERFLQMCAEDNMTVAQPSTPASHFHLLRRQAYDRPRKPLVVFTPKQLLRLKAAASPVDEFTRGTFRPVIGDTTIAPDNVDSVDRVLLCTGRVYYDLAAERDKRGDTSTAIVRVEQLYPYPERELVAELARYRDDAQLVWVQDEPSNQGAWSFIGYQMRFKTPELEGRPVEHVSRRPAAAPATGSGKVHKAQQEQLIAEAFDR